MKVLVYGAGVIGCYLTHVLCRAGNDVTLLARGAWKSVLEEKGLTIRHHLQKKTTTDHPQLGQTMDAVREGYGLLARLGYPILPEGTLDELKGIRGALSFAVMWVMAKTALGRLAATDHCRHAVSEMESLDDAWAKLRAKAPGFPMPHWAGLVAAMPDWAELHRLYDGGKADLPPRR